MKSQIHKRNSIKGAINNIYFIYASLLLSFFSACSSPGSQSADHSNRPDTDQQSSYELRNAMQTLTETITQDILSPPVASRVYAYSSLSCWEALANGSSGSSSILLHLQPEFSPAPLPPDDIRHDLAAIQAFITAAKAMVFTEDYLLAFEDHWQASLPIGKTTEASLEYGKLVANRVLQFAASDGYAQSRTYPKHGAPQEPSDWVPTPPLFMGGLEPHWNQIRPFTLDSANQFPPPPPTPFSQDPSSEFFDLVREVYTTSVNLTEEQEAIARFWDCNPYVTEEQAHLMPGIKKITPGGHWMSIAGIAAQTSKQDFTGTAKAYAWTSIALADAFISCWDEKYRSNLIRPETVINRYIDADWKPLLETPPFPEYTSGHSVISSSASEVLTALFGEPFAFADSTELMFGLPPRTFSSFRAAALEASQSRLYGGIHYRPAVEIGVTQGRMVGSHVLTRLSIENPPSQTAASSTDRNPTLLDNSTSRISVHP